VPFSPLQDTALPEHLSGLYLGGGYPELHLKALSGNTAFLHSLRAQASRKIPIYAECGGFLYLQQAVYDTDGTAYPMAQLLSGTSRRGAHLCRFGYITLTAQEDSLLGAAGTTILGHEFHYADSTENGNAFCATRPNGKHWACMQVTDHITAGFPHLYFPSQPEVAAHFAEACLQYQERNDTTTC
jgi:cobyrinic acid a,c-diamide synthase